MPAILLIDDDPGLVELLVHSLVGEGFTVQSSGSAEDGLVLAAREPFALILLDVTLPGISGFEALRRLRATSQTPVIMLTARGEEIDRVVGLEIGADDYLPKPFSLRELVARMNAILRRASRPAESSDPPSAPIALDPRSRTVRRQGKPLDLTTAEFDLLRMLMDSAGTPVPREDLCRDVFGREYTVFDRGIDNLISSLRRKLGPTRDGLERIKTIRNVGYQFVDLP